MSEARIVAVFAEGSFERIATQATFAEARAFSDGVSVGASCYGAGGCACYILPEDQALMVIREHSEEVSRMCRTMDALIAAGPVG